MKRGQEPQRRTRADGTPLTCPWEEDGFDVEAFYKAIAESISTVSAEDEITRRSAFTSDTVAEYKRALTGVRP